ncbi:hypothetical protein APHAL10511_002155 [Amanita phalloides]|nr:hypothetical protein APHAL10511_002155 [Amanita phalloides]
MGLKGASAFRLLVHPYRELDAHKTSKRPPNELESRLHKAAFTDAKNILTLDHAEILVSDNKARVDAYNWLLSVGLFKPLHDEKGKLVAFRAVTKSEIAATKDLTSDEKLVLDHISGARNEGIWTKTLKAKTNLHQNVVDRCLKSLVQKKLIKRVPAVNNKRIYMLEGLEPSAELTGGAWYIDGELDTGLIHHLSEACLKIIREMSFPKRHHGNDGAIYPISNCPKYPNAKDILKFIKKANITQVDLTIQDIEALLRVLTLDGEIEKLPAVRGIFWDVNAITDDDEEVDRKPGKKTKHQFDKDDPRSETRKRKKKRASKSSDSSSDEDEIDRKSRRKRSRMDIVDEPFDSDTENSKRARRSTVLFAEDSSSDGGESERKNQGRRKKSRRKHASSSDGGSSSGATNRNHGRNRKHQKRFPSPISTLLFDEIDEGLDHVYRAVRQERVPVGWTGTPCCLCPSFDFCKEGGPVNPRECVYYGDWVIDGSIAAVEDGV